MTNKPNDLSTMSETGFAAKYCKKRGCKPEDFSKIVLFRCTYPLTTPLARLIWLVSRDFFREDLSLIEEIKDESSFARIRDIVSFHSIQPRKRNLLRKWFRVRLSKNRLLNLARHVLKKDDD
jgi:hypothetical protein